MQAHQEPQAAFSLRGVSWRLACCIQSTERTALGAGALPPASWLGPRATPRTPGAQMTLSGQHCEAQEATVSLWVVAFVLISRAEALERVETLTSTRSRLRTP